MDGNPNDELFASRTKERRAYPRYSVDEDCTLLIVNHGMPIKARTIDLSVEGCRVRTAEPFAVKMGRPVEVSFKVKGFAFRLSGVVRWTDGHRTIGIHFENILARRKSELVEVIDEMASSQAARSTAVDHAVAGQEILPPHHPDTQAIHARTEPPIIEAIADYLIAKPVDAPAQTKPAAAEAPASSAAQFLAPHLAKPRDRRIQARHAVDTSATIFLVRGGSELKGRILDLSLGGCRIRTNERFPLGIYTRVETEFHLQGLPFRLGGVIQAIHDKETVGIRFLDLSERKRQQVLDLIGEIEQMREEVPQHEESPENQGSQENH